MTVDLDMAWAELLQAIHVGIISGHHPAPCDKCGAVMMLAPSRSGRACGLTPRCEGTHQVTL